MLVVIGEKGRLSLSKLEEGEGGILHNARSKWKVKREDVESQLEAMGEKNVGKSNEMGKTQGGYNKYGHNVTDGNVTAARSESDNFKGGQLPLQQRMNLH